MNTPPRAPQQADAHKRETMFEAEMLNQQLQQLEEHLGRIDKQMAEVLSLKESLDGYSQVKRGDELLVPLAAGIFAKATATDDRTLHVNVGQGIVVPKSVDEVKKMLDEQLAEMKTYDERMHQEFDRMLARLREIEQEFSKE